jgi:hypothetical protein
VGVQTPANALSWVKTLGQLVIYINAFVLCAYAFFGAMLLAGYLLNKGVLEAFASFGGWFLTAYSISAYAIVAVIYFFRRGPSFWATLYPVNFSLALIGILLFGLYSAQMVLPLLVFAVLGAGIGLLVARTSLVKSRMLPLVSLTPLSLCFVPSITSHWTLVFSLVAAYLLASFADAYVKLHMRLRS